MKASEARAKAIEAMDKNIECHEELEKIYKIIIVFENFNIQW